MIIKLYKRKKKPTLEMSLLKFILFQTLALNNVNGKIENTLILKKIIRLDK